MVAVDLSQETYPDLFQDTVPGLRPASSIRMAPYLRLLPETKFDAEEIVVTHTTSAASMMFWQASSDILQICWYMLVS